MGDSEHQAATFIHRHILRAIGRATHEDKLGAYLKDLGETNRLLTKTNPKTWSAEEVHAIADQLRPLHDLIHFVNNRQ